MKTKHIGIFLCAGSAVALSLPGLAQEAGQEQSSVLEEIVVTAERREQSLQDIPLSITAFGSEKRDLVGIMTIQEMADFAPGVSYNTSNDSPSIRGIARESNIYTLDSPVANYVDGVYTSTVQDAGRRRPIFVERTEILRGPQGALAGRGSIAGAVNTIMKRPKHDFGVEMRTFTGSYESYGAEATVTGPLTDWLRGRINLGSYRQDEGFFENVSTGDTEGSQLNENDLVDILWEADLGDNFEWFGKVSWVDYTESRHSTVSLAPYSAAWGTRNDPAPWGATSSGFVPLAGWGYFDPMAVRAGNSQENPAISDVWEFTNDTYSTQELTDDYNNYTSHLTWHAPSFDVKWIMGKQDYSYTQWEDADGTDVQQMTLYGFPIPGTPYATVQRTVDPGGVSSYQEARHWGSNEITFTSTHGGPIQWVVGLFRSDEETRQEPYTATYAGYDELAAPAMTGDDLLAIFGQSYLDAAAAETDPVVIADLLATAQELFDAANLANVGRPVLPNAPGQSVFSRIDAETTSQAVFGQLDYQMNDELKFTLGLRYNEDKKEATESARFVANNLGVDFYPFLAGGAFGGPMSVDVTPAPDGSPLPEGVAYDDGIDPNTGRRTRDLEAEWDATTGSIGVDYTPDDDTLIFFRTAAGYRPGGFNAGFINDVVQVDEETVYSYEVGYKGTLMDRLQLNTTAFYYDFRDAQQELPTLGRCTNPSDLSSCSPINSFINLPKSESLGLEVELNWAVTDSLGAYFTYGYLDATVKDGMPKGSAGFTNPDDPAAVLEGASPYAPIPGQVDKGYTWLPRYTQDITGNQLKNAPKHRTALNLNYSWDFSAGSLTLSGNYIWRDEAYSDLFETEMAKIPSYTMFGLRALWTDAANRYTVIVYGSNLTDEEAPYSAGVSRQSTGLASEGSADEAGQVFHESLSLAPPRQYGLELQYRFGAGY